MVAALRTLSSYASFSSPVAMAAAVAAVLVAVISLGEPVGAVAAYIPTPDISPEVEKTRFESGANALLNIWEHSLRVDGQGSGPVTRLSIEPKTILSPNAFEFVNLVPQDASHPLYADADLRRDFLFDHLVLQPVDPKNKSLSEQEGLTVRAMSGRELVFRRDAEGKLTVNDILVEQVTPLRDGTFVYVPASILFDHKEKVQVAFRESAGIPIDLEKELENIGPPLDLELKALTGAGEPVGPPTTFLVPGTFPPGSDVPLQPAILVFSDVQPPAPPRLAPGVVASPAPVGPPAPPRTKSSPIVYPPGERGSPTSSSSISLSSSSSSSSSSSVVQQVRNRRRSYAI